MGFLLLLFGTICAFKISSAKDAPKTQVFVESVEPSLFNWTNANTNNGYWYRAALISSPDLPPWMSYHFSKKHGKGFIYGVPPHDASDVQVEVIGLNRQDYETRRTIIPINVTDKTDPAKYEIHLKIDNLNLDDMFEPNRVFRLLNTFTTVLWQESDDLYMTYLVSALKLGARLPLLPNEGEGVVVHLGSSKPFSAELEELEQEVSPLRKLTPCPRALKRSTVDRHFRPKDFLIDWCSFRLVVLQDESNTPTAYKEKPSTEDINSNDFSQKDDLIRREDIPKRDYGKEIMATLIVPLISLLTLAAFLSLLLCVQHDNFGKQHRDETPSQSVEHVQRHQVTLRDGHDNDGSPRLSAEREDSCRPSPPPYSATKRFVFDS